MKLSIIIPSYLEPHLQKTVSSILEHSGLGDQLEVIVVLDGYWPNPPLEDDKRVKLIHLGENKGMRNAINLGVKASTGEYIMKSDGHNAYGDNFDSILLERIKDNWIVVPVQYFLNTETWEIMDQHPPVIYNKLLIHPKYNKFTGQAWRTRDKDRKDKRIDSTMAMQGSCWVMARSWWDKVIGELQEEGYGTFGQDSIEMVMKTWQAGGHLMVNKNAWFAHKHRDLPRTHEFSGKEAADSYNYAMKVWGDYYEKEVRPKWGLKTDTQTT